MVADERPASRSARNVALLIAVLGVATALLELLATVLEVGAR